MQHEPPLGRGKTVAASLLFGLVLFVTYNACESALGRIGRQTLVSRNGLEPVLGKGDRLLVRRQSEYRRGDIVVQQELGRDARTFHDALMHFLRLDPDVICIGEVRDGDTIAAALLAAETGHLVIATLHTTSAAQTVERILTAIPPDRRAGAAVQLAHCLRGVVTQQLLPTADMRSRVLAYEVMLVNPAVRNCIKESKLAALQDIIQSSAADGMRTLDMCLRELHQRGRISYDTATTYARDPKSILSLSGRVL